MAPSVCLSYLLHGRTHLRFADPVEGFWLIVCIETPDGRSTFSCFNGPTLTLRFEASDAAWVAQENMPANLKKNKQDDEPR